MPDKNKFHPIPVIIGVIALVIFLAALFIFIGKSKSSNTAGTQLSNPLRTRPSAAPPVATQDVYDIKILDNRFQPDVLKVKAGKSVIWLNSDNTDHTVVETDKIGKALSPPMAKGEGYLYTYTAPGTYTYHCSIHPQMTGKIIVE